MSLYVLASSCFVDQNFRLTLTRFFTISNLCAFSAPRCQVDGIAVDEGVAVEEGKACVAYGVQPDEIVKGFLLSQAPTGVEERSAFSFKRCAEQDENDSPGSSDMPLDPDLGSIELKISGGVICARKSLRLPFKTVKNTVADMKSSTQFQEKHLGIALCVSRDGQGLTSKVNLFERAIKSEKPVTKLDLKVRIRRSRWLHARGIIDKDGKPCRKDMAEVHFSKVDLTSIPSWCTAAPKALLEAAAVNDGHVIDLTLDSDDEPAKAEMVFFLNYNSKPEPKEVILSLEMYGSCESDSESDSGQLDSKFESESDSDFFCY